MAFEQYCVVELFGHQQIAGLVTEQEIARQPESETTSVGVLEDIPF